MAEAKAHVDVDVDIHVRQRPPRTINMGDGLILEGELAAAMVAINRDLLNNSNIEVSEVAMFTANQLVARLEKMLYVNPLGRLEVEYPATPWEHFRAEHFPKTRLGRWLLRRKPVRMHCEVRSCAVAFPETTAAIYPTSLGKPVFVTRETPFRGEQE